MSDKNLEQLRDEVAAAFRQDSGLRARVRELTLKAIQDRRLDTEETKAVVKAVAAGIGLGAEQRGGEAGQALREAVAGLDEALGKAAHATHLALQQLTSQAKDFGDSDLAQAVERLKGLETELESALRQLAAGASERLKPELAAAAEHLKRTGGDTAREVAATLEGFRNRLSAVTHEGGHAAAEAAREVSLRLAALAGGILAGLSEGLKKRD